jgi:hypothetical protein
VRLKKLFELSDPREDKAVGAIWLLLIFVGLMVLFVNKVRREIESVDTVEREKRNDADSD